MQIIWEYHHNGYVWFEWIENGRSHLKRFTIESFNKFMDDQGLLDFLN